MLNIPRFSLKLRRFFRGAVWFPLTFLLSAAQLSGLYAPCALAVVSLSGAGRSGIFSLLGAALGAWVFFDFQPGLRYFASAVLIFAASLAFYDADIYRRPAFRPVAAAISTSLVQSVWLAARPVYCSAVFLCALMIQVGCFFVLAPLLHRDPTAQQRHNAALLLWAALCTALLPLKIGHFSPGQMLFFCALFLCALHRPVQECITAAAAAGILSSLAAQPYQPFCIALFIGAAAAARASFHALSSRTPAVFFGCIGAAACALLFEADYPAAVLAEAICGALLCLSAARFLPRHRAAACALKSSCPEDKSEAQPAAALHALYDSLFRTPVPCAPENPSVIFDRAAEQVCRRCVLCSSCWHEHYHATYTAFNDACPVLLHRGQAQPQDFPLYFTSRCVHISEFIAALNTELRIFLQRQQYHRRLAETRRAAREQYAQLGELLRCTTAVEAMSPAPLGYQIGSALRPREGNEVCGDQVSSFEVGDTLYLLLCDGMGSGSEAHRDAAMTIRLLRQFLAAGIEPLPALKTLNSAMRLRSEDGGGFTTIDLLALQRSSGSATLYKYGAAPSYLKRSATVTRFTAASLPAGLHDSASPPEASRFSLPSGSFLVMVSDGIADETEDEWLQNLLAGWQGDDSRTLTELILAESRSRKGLSDDCAVLVLHLSPPGSRGKFPV